MNLNFWTIDRFLAEKVDLVPETPLIDLTVITFIEPFALIYLGMYLRHHNRNGKVFKVILPQDRDVRQYLARMNFWERFNFDPESVQREKLLRFTSTTSLNDIVDIEKEPTIVEEITDGVVKLLWNAGVNVNKTNVAAMVSELVDNFSQHAESSLAAFTMQYYPRGRRLDIAIGDCGIGIRQSLSSNPKYGHLRHQPHEEAALLAFEPMVTRKNEGGTGLMEVKDGIIAENGTLVIATGNGYVRIEGENIEKGSMYLDLPGVQLQMSFPERL